jgi:hypothetical protein
MDRLGIEMLSVFGMAPVEYSSFLPIWDAVISQLDWSGLRR